MSPASEKKTWGIVTGPFVVSALVLGGAAIALPTMVREMRIALRKAPAPMRESLANLDKSALGPFRFVSANVLDPAVVESLGTDEYIDWVLEDTRYRRTTNPLRVAQLHVTYYTGQSDPVPHTPDVCRKGSGYELTDAMNTTLRIDELGDDTEVPVRLVTFLKSGIFNGVELPVLYLFHCNGQFVATREGVRNLVSNPLARHAYYSKVEVTFGWEGGNPPYPSRGDVLAGSRDLLSYVLPLLLEHHWPDWDALESGDGSDSSEQTAG